MAGWSERNLIRKIRLACSGAPEGLIQGIGDDCCEVGGAHSWLISTDTLVDGIHFDRSWHPAHLLGRKSMAVNLSDIAAMGGRPRFALLSLCLPRELDEEWLDQWLEGSLEILGEFDCLLIGGDTVQGRELVLTVTFMGEPVGSGPIYRSGARPGDTIWVSGMLGSAGAGLSLLAGEKREPGIIGGSRWHPLLDAHLDPLPQVKLGMELAMTGMVTAMQDISDGLATDLAHLCQASGAGALLQPEQIPVHPQLAPAADLLNMEVEDLALRSGEDYQLVFTVRGDRENEFRDWLAQQDWSLSMIGRIRQGAGVFLDKAAGEEEISFQGYEH